MAGLPRTGAQKGAFLCMFSTLCLGLHAFHVMTRRRDPLSFCSWSKRGLQRSGHRRWTAQAGVPCPWCIKADRSPSGGQKRALQCRTSLGSVCSLSPTVRYDLNNPAKHAKLDFLNNLATGLVFIIVVVNIFITAFGVQKPMMDVAPRQ